MTVPTSRSKQPMSGMDTASLRTWGLKRSSVETAITTEEAGHEMAKRVAEMPTIEAITREQFAKAAKQLMNEFTANDGYGTSASATFLALCFGNLELRLFGMDGDSE